MHHAAFVHLGIPNGRDMPETKHRAVPSQQNLFKTVLNIYGNTCPQTLVEMLLGPLFTTPDLCPYQVKIAGGNIQETHPRLSLLPSIKIAFSEIHSDHGNVERQR